MTINRHNYETYFILYMDNELGTEERRMVEMFVRQHPDLQEELELLMQFKLAPDAEIIYPGKEELMQAENGSPVNISNYEEWFTLYTDEELTADQREMVEQFILQHPGLAGEFRLFRATRSAPEPVLFPGKETLYRSEAKLRPLAGRWWRVAAAVLLLFGISIVTYNALNKKPASKPGNEISKSAEPVKTGDDNVNNPVNSDSPAGTQLAAADPGKDPVRVAKTDMAVPGSQQPATKKLSTAVVNNAVPGIRGNEIPSMADNRMHSNNLPQPDQNPNAINPIPEARPVYAGITPPSPEEKVNALQNANSTVTNDNSHSSDIRTASFKETFDEDDGKKNKLRGFFRKITRTFEKRTDMDVTDDDKLLVAGLAIKLK